MCWQLSAAAQTLGGVSFVRSCKLARARRACHAGVLCLQEVLGGAGCLAGSWSSQRMNLLLFLAVGLYGSASTNLL